MIKQTPTKLINNLCETKIQPNTNAKCEDRGNMAFMISFSIQKKMHPSLHRSNFYPQIVHQSSRIIHHDITIHVPKDSEKTARPYRTEIVLGTAQ
jgi:hypothetical protein